MKLKKTLVGIFSMGIIVGTVCIGAIETPANKRNMIETETDAIEKYVSNDNAVSQEQTKLSVSELDDMDLECFDIEKIKQLNEDILCTKINGEIKEIEVNDETFYFGLDSDESKIYTQTDIDNMWEEIDKNIVVEENGENQNISVCSINYEKGTYPENKGNILVTSDFYKGLIPTGHAGIVYSKDSVVESLKKGVCKRSNNWKDRYNTVYGLVVDNASTNGGAGKAADYCKDKIGKEYNFNYEDVTTRDKFYCSQLVWAAYLDCCNIDLNTTQYGKAVHPMELVNSNKTTVIYRGGKYELK